jgi:hypothetical protein
MAVSARASSLDETVNQLKIASLGLAALLLNACAGTGHSGLVVDFTFAPTHHTPQEASITAALNNLAAKNVTNACLIYSLQAGEMLQDKFGIKSTMVVYSGMNGWDGTHAVLVYETIDHGKVRHWLVDNRGDPTYVRGNYPDHWIWETTMGDVGRGYNFYLEKVVKFPLDEDGMLYVGAQILSHQVATPAPEVGTVIVGAPNPEGPQPAPDKGRRK